MEKIPIGLIIKQIIKENNLSAIDVAGKLGVSRQAVYHAFSRDKMSLDERKAWADALGIDVSEFDKRSGLSKPNTPDDYLMKYIASLEARIAEQERTITVLLGKSDSVSLVGFAAIIYMIIAPNLGTLVNEGNGIFFGVYLQ